MTDIAAWKALAEKLGKTGYNIFGTADVQITDKGFSDEKFLALILLARTMSNFKGALLMLREKRIVEARTITRCCLENKYWVGALSEEGEKFARKMLHDEMSHRKARGHRIFRSDVQLEADVDARLREWMKSANRQFADAKTLNPSEVASTSDSGRSYILYGELSSDSAHPSVDALKRYVVPDKHDEIGGIDVEPVVKDEEIVETLEFLCLAVMGVCIDVNQILGGTPGGEALNKLADECKELSNKSNARAHPRACY